MKLPPSRSSTMMKNRQPTSNTCNILIGKAKVFVLIFLIYLQIFDFEQRFHVWIQIVIIINLKLIIFVVLSKRGKESGRIYIGTIFFIHTSLAIVSHNKLLENSFFQKHASIIHTIMKRVNHKSYVGYVQRNDTRLIWASK